MTIKTNDGWESDLTEYLQIGEVVDEEMKEYFVNVMFPACWTHFIIQMGEAYSHVNGRPTYATLNRTPDGWTYAGHCHRGETEEPRALLDAKMEAK